MRRAKQMQKTKPTESTPVPLPALGIKYATGISNRPFCPIFTPPRTALALAHPRHSPLLTHIRLCLHLHRPPACANTAPSNLFKPPAPDSRFDCLAILKMSQKV